MAKRWEIRPGMVVRGHSGLRLGKVRAHTDALVEIERGLLFKDTFRAPLSAIERVEDGELVLGARPAPLEREAPRDAEVRLPLAEEEVNVEKRARIRYDLRVHKRVVTEERTVTVTLRKEVVTLEKVPRAEPALPGPVADAVVAPFGAEAGLDADTEAGSPAASEVGGEAHDWFGEGLGITRQAAAEEAFARARPTTPFVPETLEIPLWEEEFEIVKRPVVREVARITRTAVSEDKTLQTTVRREVVDVLEPGDSEPPASH